LGEAFCPQIKLTKKFLKLLVENSNFIDKKLRKSFQNPKLASYTPHILSIPDSHKSTLKTKPN
jgi:hypothetical protein